MQPLEYHQDKQMVRRSQWIMKEEQYEQFWKRKQNAYKAQDFLHDNEDFNDHKITKLRLRNILKYLRKRNPTVVSKHHEEKLSQEKHPFKFEKIIFLAVTLFRHYYLLTTYISSPFDHNQSFLCSFFISMKMNEYDNVNLQKMAIKWKKKSIFVEESPSALYFGDQNYTEVELGFLKGLQFQTGYSKVIQSIQSLYNFVNQKRTQVKCTILAYLDRLYLDQKALYLHQGPKLALAIVLCSLDKHLIDVACLGEVNLCIAANVQEVNKLKKLILGLQDYNSHVANEDKVQEILKKLKKCKFNKPEKMELKKGSFSPKPKFQGMPFPPF